MHSLHKYVVTLAGLGFSVTAVADSGSPFGFEGPLTSSLQSIDAAAAEADPTALISVANGLLVNVVSAAPALGANIDQMVLWPDGTNPTHLIMVNEEGTTEVAIQRLRLSDGLIETLLVGLDSGDPIRLTPWGTILAGEEAGATGQMLEIINPLDVTDVVYDRLSGSLSGGVGAENVAPRWALGRLSFEGLAILPSGVVYYGDEGRPSNGTAGGAYFKFVPATPFAGVSPIARLEDSPFVSGQVYGMRLSLGSNSGQGNNTGLGVWVPVPNSDNADLKAAAAALHLTGYYRPEDMDIDLKALAAGDVRVCGNNTGNEPDHNYGETICISDGKVADATANLASPEVQFLILGNPEFAMMDNIAYHPTRGFWVVQEDGDGPSVGVNNDLFACLEDGNDFDLLSDGCERFGTLNDLNAESTGGFFDATGEHYYVSIQHNVTGHGVILDITGWTDAQTE